MRLRLCHLCAVILAILSALSCARSLDPTSPPPQMASLPETRSNQSGHFLLSYCLVSFDADTNLVNVLPLRDTADHWNVLSFLEKGPCTDCLKIVGVDTTPDGNKLFDVRITHPFPGTNLTGFDVRGIAMFNASRAFPTSMLTVSDSTLGDGELINAEGYTTLYNPFTWGMGPGGLKGYFPGKFSTVNFPSATLNGYIRHITENPSNTRNAFYAGDAITRTYEIKFPQGQKFVFGYAVDASWAPPINVPVLDPMEDFPISANCPEPWKIDVLDLPSHVVLTPDGGSVAFEFDIYDYQGSTSLFEPTVECPELFDGVKTAQWVSDEVGYSTWRVGLENEKAAPPGNYEFLVVVEDHENTTSPSYLDLTAYRMHDIEVVEGGWARSWGGSELDSAWSTAVDVSGNIYVTGQFKSAVDFDPGDGVLDRTSNGNEDAFLSKFDPQGNLLWNQTWGGEYHESCEGIVIDPIGWVYVVGYFNETVDFDPGPGVDEHISHGDWDSLLAKYTSDGEFVWAKTWGAPAWDQARDVAVDGAGGVYVAGYFFGNCDFDPGPGEAYEGYIPGASYLTKFDSNGDHQWVKAWAGDGGYDDLATAVASDSSGNVVVTGVFDGTVDLNPGNGVKHYTAPTVYQDIYLSCFNSNGGFQWGCGWGGEYDDWGYDVAIDGAGNVYSTGKYAGTADFDPGPGQDEHTSNGERDVYLVKYTIPGNYQWTRTWGGFNYNFWTYGDSGHGVTVDPSTPAGNVFVTGYFSSTVDFDPGPGIDERTSNGSIDAFLNVLDPSGNYLWSRTVGGGLDDYAWDVAVDMSGHSFIAGSFMSTVDFNPDKGEYNLASKGNWDCCLLKYIDWGNW